MKKVSLAAWIMIFLIIACIVALVVFIRGVSDLISAPEPTPQPIVEAVEEITTEEVEEVEIYSQYEYAKDGLADSVRMQLSPPDTEEMGPLTQQLYEAAEKERQAREALDD